MMYKNIIQKKRDGKKSILLSIITISLLNVTLVINAGPILGLSDIKPQIKTIKNLLSPERVPDSYIVTYNQSSIESAREGKGSRGQTKSINQVNIEFTQSIVTTSNSEITAVYGHAINGAAVYNTDQQAIENLLNDPRIDQIYANTYMYLLDYEESPQTAVPWGLDRVDQSSSTLNSEYHFANTGSDVHVFVVDSGIDSSHPEFRGKDITGFSFNGEDCFDLTTCSIDFILNSTDSNGHGTHVAGIIDGETYGVAKDVNLYSYNIFTGEGLTTHATVINALNKIHYEVELNQLFPAVVNMSFGSRKSGTPEDFLPMLGSLSSLDLLGVHLVAAAGNSGNEEAFFPASFVRVISVGASTISNNQDIRPSFSNFGSNVDIYAPGFDILSANANTNTSTRKDGTSMASPFVTGAIALYLQNTEHRNDSPSQVKEALISSATSVNFTFTPDEKLLHSTALTPAASQTQIQADIYDDIAIRGYTDDVAGDSVPLYPGAQNHNFHDQGDVDWTIIAVASGLGYDINTTQLGDASARMTAYEVYPFPVETFPGSGRWTIISSQLTQVEVDNSSSNNSVTVQNTSDGLKAYAIKTYSSGAYGDNTNYQIQAIESDPIDVITWINKVGVSTTNNTISKTTANYGWNAGAVSVQVLNGNGYLEFTKELNTAVMIGLSNGDSSVYYTDID